MNQYQITTAQNVTIKLTIANMGDRILACLIDLFILTGYLLLVLYIYKRTYGYILDNFDSQYEYLIYFVATLPVYFYTLLFEFFMNGQTPGKRLRKIKVVRMDGESLTIGNCIARWLFRLVDIWIDYGSVAIVAATFSRIHQRVGDMVAGTIVISTVRQADIDVSQYAEQDPSGNVHFPQVEKLKLRDMEVVNEALSLYYDQDKFDYVAMVSAQLKTVLEVTPETDDLTFVKRIVTDYNQMHKVPLV